MDSAEILTKAKKRIDWAYDKGEKGLLESSTLEQIRDEIKYYLASIISSFGEDNQLRYKKLTSGWTNVLKPGFTDLATAQTILIPLEKMMSFMQEELELEQKPDEIYFSPGERLRGVYTLSEIFRSAQAEIAIQDNFLHPNILALLEPYIFSGSPVKVRLLTRSNHNSSLNALKVSIEACKSDYPDSMVDAKTNDQCHDRFIIIDNNLGYHSGPSFHQLGLKASRISKIESESELEKVRTDFNSWWDSGSDLL